MVGKFKKRKINDVYVWYLKLINRVILSLIILR